MAPSVVVPGMIVAEEPKAGDPRKALDEVLAPLGLEARDDPSGAILIVKAPPGERAKSMWVEDVVVTPGRREIVPQDVASPRTLDGNDVTTSPTLGSDPVRAISLLPGIASADASATFSPRGAEPRDVAMILDGVLKEGDPLPSVRTVAAENRVNPLTVLKGYQQLVDEGLVETRRGRGMFINAGARDLLLEGERQKFLGEEWPRIYARVQRLGLRPEELLKAAESKTLDDAAREEER